MARRPLHLLIFAFFVGSLTIWGVAKGEPHADPLQPEVQTVDATTFDQVVEDALLAKALPQSVQREGRINAAAAPFTHFMLRWEATLTETEDIAFEARASIDGAAWTPWGSVATSDDLSDPEQAPDVRWSTTVYAGLARFWQLRVTLTPMDARALPVLRNVQVHTLDTRTDAAPIAPSAEYGASAFAIQQPTFVPRSAWGGAAVEARSVAPQWHPATHMVIHHTADANTLVGDENNWGDRVRAEWAFHTYSRGWGDIAYNWLIDPNGVVYEGRKGSSDPTRDAVGFHDTANYGSMGVALLGSFGRTAQPPTSRAMGTLAYLLAWKAQARSIDPLASSAYYGCSKSRECRRTNPNSVMLNIAGHRQVTGATSCPGDLTMAQLGTLRSVVQTLLDRAAAAPTPGASAPTTAATPVGTAATTTPTLASTPTATSSPTITPTPTATSSPTVTPSPTASPTPRPRTRIEGAVRWTRANSPVVLLQDQVIPAGSSLVIEAGVEVQLGPQVDVFVEGELYAQGTIDAPIRFHGTTRRWGGLNGAPASTIVLEHTMVNDGGANGVAIASIGGRVTLLAAAINANTGGVRLDGAALDMRASRVWGNTTVQGAAVNVRLGAAEAVTIQGNRFDGVDGRAGAAQVRIEVVPGRTGTLTVTDNTFTGGTGPLLELEASAPASGTISCNAFEGGAIGFKLNATTPSAANFALAIEQNAFGGQTVVGAASTIALGAPRNWWGHATGPADVLRNPAGQGVRVGVNVDFQPVLSERPACTVE